MAKIAVVTHGGAGAPRIYSDGAERAAKAALEKITQTHAVLAGVLAGACVLEDDPRFNAGTGSNFRLDGETIEMDAAVMTSDGRSGAIANLRETRNPVLVAAAVREKTPHLLVSGDGATTLARRLGFAPYDPSTPDAREKLARARALFLKEQKCDDESAPWPSRHLGDVWNFATAYPGDTIGCVARDEKGEFAAAASTGGTLLMLRGRVGDTPLIGCGLYAGPAGAVATTGVGEEIVRRFLAKTVYDFLQAGLDAQAACERGVGLFPAETAVGIIAVGVASEGYASNREMPAAIAR